MASTARPLRQPSGRDNRFMERLLWCVFHYRSSRAVSGSLFTAYCVRGSSTTQAALLAPVFLRGCLRGLIGLHLQDDQLPVDLRQPGLGLGDTRLRFLDYRRRLDNHGPSLFQEAAGLQCRGLGVLLLAGDLLDT